MALSRIRIRRNAAIFWTLSAGFVFIIIFSLRDPNINPIELGDSNRPDFEFEGVKISQLDRGRRTWELHADHAQIHKQKQLTELTKISGNIFYGNKSAAQFSSPKAKLQLDSSQFNLENPTVEVVLNERLYTIRSKKLNWNGNRQQLRASGSVNLQTEGLTLSGDTFYVDIPIKKLVISQRGSAKINAYFK